MHFNSNFVFRQEKSELMRQTFTNRGNSRNRGTLQAVAVVLLGLTAGMPAPVFAQQAPKATDNVLRDLPPAPVPTPTEPLNLRPSTRDFSKPYARLLGNPFKPYGPTHIPTRASPIRCGSMIWSRTARFI
jgi:hypothetical protein